MESAVDWILKLPKPEYDHVQTWGAAKREGKKYWHIEPNDKDKAAVARAKRDGHFDYFAWIPGNDCWWPLSREACQHALERNKGK